MYSISYLRRQVDALRHRLKPVLAILRLRNLAVEFCDEYEEAAYGEKPAPKHALSDKIRMFMPRVGRAGFRLDTFQDLNKYLHLCLDNQAAPQPREMVFTLIPWARKGPRLRPDLWERPNPQDDCKVAVVAACHSERSEESYPQRRDPSLLSG